MVRGKEPPNILILGASGSVARAVLRRLGAHRDRFGALVLLDKNRRVCRDTALDHERLRYRFICHRVRFPDDNAYYERLLRRRGISIVLDLSTLPTLPVLRATDAAGVSYLNTSLNDDELEVLDLVVALHPTRHLPTQAPHILCCGMNPGIVNMWVCHALAHFGLPRDIIHFESDTSMTQDKWRPLVTWSKEEFLAETTWNRTGLYVGRRTKLLNCCAMERLVSLRPILQPIRKQETYPQGFLVLHEENLTLGRAIGVPSRFIYAIHPRTTGYLVERFRKKGTLRESDIETGDNVKRRLSGEDTVGVCLIYPGKRVYYLNTMANAGVQGTNATCAQVALGVYCALFTLLVDRLKPRIYFTGDMYDTAYPVIMFRNVAVQQFVCRKRRGEYFVAHTPQVRFRRKGRAASLVI